jgi:hypothetical protein
VTGEDDEAVSFIPGKTDERKIVRRMEKVRVDRVNKRI